MGTANTDGHVTAARGVLHERWRSTWPLSDVPPARIPGEGGEQLDDLPADAATDLAPPCSMPSTAATRHLAGHSPQALIATLARVVLPAKTQASIYQMLEAGVRQFTAWGDTEGGGTSSLQLSAILRPTRRPNARHCRRPTSPGA